MHSKSPHFIITVSIMCNLLPHTQNRAAVCCNDEQSHVAWQPYTQHRKGVYKVTGEQYTTIAIPDVFEYYGDLSELRDFRNSGPARTYVVFQCVYAQLRSTSSILLPDSDVCSDICTHRCYELIGKKTHGLLN